MTWGGAQRAAVGSSIGCSLLIRVDRHDVLHATDPLRFPLLFDIAEHQNAPYAFDPDIA
jgi:hypothetical protein